MASYAVSERIVAANPHVRFGSSDRPSDAGTERAVEVNWRDVQPNGLERLTDDDDGFDAWLERMRTAWDQTTWYLFNSEGWR